MTIEKDVESFDAPEALIDFNQEFPKPPEDFQIESFGPREKASILRLFHTRTCWDPILNKPFEANDMKDFFRFGWFATNIGVTIGKRKPLGGSGFEFDAGLLCPIIAPGSYFTPADYGENKHSMNFYLETRSGSRTDDKLPKYMREWHREDVAELKDKFMACREYFQLHGPAVDKEFNIYTGNRHWRDAQRAHRLAALTWQAMQTFDKAKGMQARELNAWCYVLSLEMLHNPEPSRDLAIFVSHRMEDCINLTNFNDVGFQNYMSRYVFLMYWLGEAEMAWDKACEISKLRQSEFTKSPMYDAIIEMKNDPAEIAGVFNEKPAECLVYYAV